MKDREQASAFRMLMRRTVGTRPMAWLGARTLHHIDGLVYRLTRGRSTFSTWMSGLLVVMLTTTGARTGRQRTLPVLGIPDGENLIVIASNFGQQHHPAWYHNLRAHPRAWVAVDGVTQQVEAHVLSGQERDLWYERGIAINPGWVRYRERAARQIPVIRLEPTS